MTGDREAIGPLPNPAGLEGVEFVEFSTSKPLLLGPVLEAMGFQLVGRHRAREVLRYRAGDMNIVVNGHEVDHEAPVLTALALRTRDAAAAWRGAVARGAWPVEARAEPMALHIPAIRGVGASRLCFVDRWREFSIWDVDFLHVPGADPAPPAVAGMHWFGLVQYIGLDRMDDWTEFYAELFGMRSLAPDERFGILPSGRLLQSPCGLMLQLIEPPIDAAAPGLDEALHRIGFGVPDVAAAVQALRGRGVDFVETPNLHPEPRGALTRPLPGGPSFELVRNPT